MGPEFFPDFIPDLEEIKKTASEDKLSEFIQIVGGHEKHLDFFVQVFFRSVAFPGCNDLHPLVVHGVIFRQTLAGHPFIKSPFFFFFKTQTVGFMDHEEFFLGLHFSIPF